MSIGSIVWKIRHRFRGGLRASYWREIVRPRILATPPVDNLTDTRAEIHVLTSTTDWLNLVWVLKSFYWASGRRYCLCVHDDGTLTPEQVEQTRGHFPDARVISRAEADAAVLPSLVGAPRCHEFRRTNLLAPKVFDFAHYLRSDRMLLLDSDVLFFAEPAALLRRVEDPAYLRNTVNGDVASAYTVELADAKRCAGIDMIERFNSGLGLIHKESIRTDWLEEFLGLPGVIGHFWRIEQTLFALSSSRFGCELLPPEYDVRLAREPNHGPVRHYVGAIRHYMFRDGVRRLVRQGLLRGGTVG
jgi:hypothetical protein